jgi:ATP-binding protein involved in chromosome partitioning
MPVTEEHIRALLTRVTDPNTGQDLVASGQVRGIGIDGDKVAVELVLGYPAASWHGALAEMAEAVLRADPGIAALRCRCRRACPPIRCRSR